MKNVKPQAQPDSIIVATDSLPVQLSFNIRGVLDGAQHLFITDNQKDNHIQLSRTVSELKTSPHQSFELHRQGVPTETLLFDVQFEVEKES